MRQNDIRRGLSAAFAAATFIAVQPAAADSLSFNGLFYPGADTVHISSIAPSAAEYVYSGGFSMKDTTGPWTIGGVTTAQNASFMAWCIDIFRNMQSASYTLTGVGFGSVVHATPNASQVNALERLASNNLGSVNNAQTSSAFQLATWEIMAETSPSHNLASGNFFVYGDALGADSVAQSWLNNLGTAAPTMKLSVWRADSPGSTQDLAVFAPIPEPGTYAMMLAGIGLMGFVVRRRTGRDTA